MKIEFVVYGNHQDKLGGNPIAYHTAPPIKGETKTGKVFWRPNTDPQVIKYNGYSQHVRLALAETLEWLDKGGYHEEINKLSTVWQKKKGGKIRLFPKGQEFYHLNRIYFNSGVRGDAENIGKGIIDAIHLDDKPAHVAAIFAWDKTRPRVEVLMTDNPLTFAIAIVRFYLGDAIASKLNYFSYTQGFKPVAPEATQKKLL